MKIMGFLFCVMLLMFTGSAIAACNKVLINNVNGSASTPTPRAGHHVFLTQLILFNVTGEPEIVTSANVGQVLSGMTPMNLTYEFEAPAGTSAELLWPYSDSIEGVSGAPITVTVAGSQASLVTINAVGCLM